MPRDMKIHGHYSQRVTPKVRNLRTGPQPPNSTCPIIYCSGRARPHRPVRAAYCVGHRLVLSGYTVYPCDERSLVFVVGLVLSITPVHPSKAGEQTSHRVSTQYHFMRHLQFRHAAGWEFIMGSLASLLHNLAQITASISIRVTPMMAPADPRWRNQPRHQADSQAYHEAEYRKVGAIALATLRTAIAP
ncbi:hypothetical protein EDB81DRAFT_175559 [Dactylonectria macrodidyma]|uniref:Uncharacterized protein n=1 Tax=Dactylonectria macrodidyma TaxID=307937 RepID=A0A9P9JHE6_9HYPO|nr:hypothetical protein EDB81DRAFT_175559 [Dactylonectria macrodidyma]